MTSLAEIAAQDQIGAAQKAITDIKAQGEQLLFAQQTAQQTATANARKAAEDKIRAAQAEAEAAIRAAQAQCDTACAAIRADTENQVRTATAGLEAAQKALESAKAARVSQECAAQLTALGAARSKATQAVRELRSLSTPADPIEIAAYDAKLRLAEEAQRRAEEDYSKALACIQSEHLMSLLGA